MSNKRIDLNCDLGEGMLSDESIMPNISSANVACGFHAGDEGTIRQTVLLCKKHNVAVGAHPGFNDKKNFGRVPMNLTASGLYELVRIQMEIVQKICNEMGAVLHHVKPHGALYNMAAEDKYISAAIALSVKQFNPDLVFYGLSGSCMISEAKSVGLRTANEVFADRTYQDDGMLTPRGDARALITDSSLCVKQVLQMIDEGTVTSANQKTIPIEAETVCLHGDGRHAVEFARAIHDRLVAEGITIQSIG